MELSKYENKKGYPMRTDVVLYTIIFHKSRKETKIIKGLNNMVDYFTADKDFMDFVLVEFLVYLQEFYSQKLIGLL